MSLLQRILWQILKSQESENEPRLKGRSLINKKRNSS